MDRAKCGNPLSFTTVSMSIERNYVYLARNVHLNLREIQKFTQKDIQVNSQKPVSFMRVFYKLNELD